MPLSSKRKVKIIKSNAILLSSPLSRLSHALNRINTPKGRKLFPIGVAASLSTSDQVKPPVFF